MRGRFALLMERPIPALLLSGCGLSVSVLLFLGAAPFQAWLAEAALLALTAAVFVRGSRDVFHPVALITTVWLLRVGIPAILLTAGVDPAASGYFTLRGWTQDEWWAAGFHLGACGIFSLALGFSSVPGILRPRREPLILPVAYWVRFSRIGKLLVLAGICMILYYLLLNFRTVAGALLALSSGILRSADEFAREGTSRYSHLGKDLVFWGSVLWGLSRYATRMQVRYAVFPPLLALVLLIPFGGRIVAIAPLAVFLLVTWYAKGRTEGFRAVGPGTVVKWAVVGMTAAVGFIFLGMLIRVYRGGGGIDAATEFLSLRALVNELQFTIWNEAGFLHPLAYAVRFGDGSYEAPALRMLLGGLSAVLFRVDDVPRPGEVIVEQLFGTGGWGIHTGLFVDYYMWSGLPAVAVSGVLIGATLKLAYTRLACGSHGIWGFVVYGYIFWRVFWAVFETGIGLVSSVIEGLLILIPIGLMLVLIRRSRKYPAGARAFPSIGPGTRQQSLREW